MQNPIINKYASLSLASITLAAFITSVHHVYRLGLGVLIPFAILTVLPYLLLRWFKSGGNKAVLWLYGLFTAMIFLWFGFIDGFLDHVIKALGLQHLTLLPGGQEEVVKTVFSLWSPEAGNLLYEGTGVLTFTFSTIALYYGFRFIQAVRSANVAAPMGAMKATLS
jgi:hypothetical protein